MRRKPKLVRIVGVRFPVNMSSDLWGVAEELEQTPSEVVRICVAHVMDPTRATKVLANMIQAAKSKIEEGEEDASS